MPRYYKVTALLHEDEYAFVERIAKAFNASLARAINIAVVWARNNETFRNVLDMLEKEAEQSERAEEKRD